MGLLFKYPLFKLESCWRVEKKVGYSDVLFISVIMVFIVVEPRENSIARVRKPLARGTCLAILNVQNFQNLDFRYLLGAQYFFEIGFLRFSRRASMIFKMKDMGNGHDEPPLVGRGFKPDVGGQDPDIVIFHLLTPDRRSNVTFDGT